MTEVSFGFTMPGGLTLAELDGAQCITRAPTRISVTATGTGLRFSMNPPIFVDAPWPAENVTVFGASYNYGGGVSVSTQSGEGYGWFDVSDEVRSAVSSMISGAIAGTPMARQGYNPFEDANVASTLQQIGTNAASGGGGGPSVSSGAAPGGGVSPNQLSQVGGGASLVVDGGMVYQTDAGGVQIPPGTTINVSAQGSGNMGDLGAATTDAQRGAALQLEGITITSSGITLMKGDKPVARVTGLRIGAGGVVSITAMEPLGLAADLAGVESVLRLFGGAIGLSAQGAPDGLAIALAAQDSQAEIIPGMTRQMIEDALTPAVQAMVRQHAGSLPGIDLGTALGIQPDIGPPPPPTTGAAPATTGPAGSRPSSP